MAKPVLGRGLSALLGGAAAASKPGGAPVNAGLPAGPAAINPQDRIQRVPLKRIHPCPFQPRKDFSEEGLRELADSIKEQGIVQPLIVRARGDDYELIAGERRWRAAQWAGLAEIPVILRQADDRAVLELALIENLQRENLNPMEEALGYSQLVEQFELKQEEVAGKVGKSRAVVANALRLLKLPLEIQAYLRDGRLSVGHAKVILGLIRPDEQLLATARVLKDGLNVRQTEDLVARLQQQSAVPANGKTGQGKTPPTPDAHLADLENRLQEKLGTKVQLRYRQGHGTVEIRFFSDDDLNRVLQILGISLD